MHVQSLLLWFNVGLDLAIIGNHSNSMIIYESNNIILLIWCQGLSFFVRGWLVNLEIFGWIRIEHRIELKVLPKLSVWYLGFDLAVVK